MRIIFLVILITIGACDEQQIPVVKNNRVLADNEPVGDASKPPVEDADSTPANAPDGSPNGDQATENSIITFQNTPTRITINEDVPIEELFIKAEWSGLPLADISYAFIATTCVNGWTIPLAIDAKGKASGLATQEALGECTLTIRATAAEFTLEHSIIVEVVNSNDLPQFTMESAPLSVHEDTLFGLALEASDEDANATIEYKLSEANTCLWVYKTQEPYVTGTPGNEHVGDCTLAVEAISGDDIANIEIPITVLPVNDPPTWNAVELPPQILEDSQISLAITATDIDAGSMITYAKGENSQCPWLHFNMVSF